VDLPRERFKAISLKRRQRKKRNKKTVAIHSKAIRGKQKHCNILPNGQKAGNATRGKSARTYANRKERNHGIYSLARPSFLQWTARQHGPNILQRSAAMHEATGRCQSASRHQDEARVGEDAPKRRKQEKPGRDSHRDWIRETCGLFLPRRGLPPHEEGDTAMLEPERAKMAKKKGADQRGPVLRERTRVGWRNCGGRPKKGVWNRKPEEEGPGWGSHL